MRNCKDHGSKVLTLNTQVFRMLLEYKEAKYIDKQYCTGNSFAAALRIF